ncbi:tetratricopeptide repeat-containing sensor histidine kinase [Aureispira anguillae]|uniref:Tetratricopeptide repeat protein n=1 Tax=Aureispira anguillae TaxID=2864201 RepID=A0A915YL92_9BACT|nr:histidine kinase [Aureispira anguillae]BDS15007.1 tetratricopeptide repeat protein [Aureispira anguillae]
MSDIHPYKITNSMPKCLKLFFILLFGFSITKTQGQPQQYVDSMEAAFAAEPDSIQKTSILFQLAFAHLYSNPQKGLEYLDQILPLTPKDSIDHKAGAYSLIGSTYAQIDSIPLAIDYINKAIATYESPGLTILNIEKKVAGCYINLANCFFFIKEYDQALKYAYKALTAYQSVGYTDISTVYGLLMALNLKQKEHSKALNNAIKALKLRPIGVNAFNVGLVYIELEKFDSAAYFLEKALEVYEIDQNKNDIASTASTLARVHLKQNKLELATLYINKAIALEAHLVSPLHRIELLSILGDIYLASKEYQKSILTYKKVQENAQQVASPEFAFMAQQGLANTYVELNDFKQAYQHSQEALSLKDSILDETKQGQIKDFELKYRIRYDAQKKEQENLLLSKDLALQKLEVTANKQRFYGILILLLFGIIISYLLLRQYKIRSAQQIVQLKHRLLRNQMSPHFIFNALIAIQNFVYKNDPRKAGKYLSSFAKLIRAILENSRQEYITLTKEMQWLENYLNLQLLRFNNKFDFDIQIDDQLDLESVLIPPMLTQPFIENALEHGIKSIDYQGQLTVSFSLKDDLLVVDVQDNGIGISAPNISEEKTKHISLATTITKERLDFLNQKSKKKIYFEISKVVPSGTLVSFSIPIKHIY